MLLRIANSAGFSVPGPLSITHLRFTISPHKILMIKFIFSCLQNATSRYVYSREVNQGPAA